MSREIPQNEEKTVTVSVPPTNLFAFLEAVNNERNVISVSYEPPTNSNGYKVTVHYAIMDLALQTAAISTRIQTLAEEASSGRQLHAVAS